MWPAARATPGLPTSVRPGWLRPGPRCVVSGPYRSGTDQVPTEHRLPMGAFTPELADLTFTHAKGGRSVDDCRRARGRDVKRGDSGGGCPPRSSWRRSDRPPGEQIYSGDHVRTGGAPVLPPLLLLSPNVGADLVLADPIGDVAVGIGRFGCEDRLAAEPVQRCALLRQDPRVVRHRRSLLVPATHPRRPRPARPRPDPIHAMHPRRQSSRNDRFVSCLARGGTPRSSNQGDRSGVGRTGALGKGPAWAGRQDG